MNVHPKPQKPKRDIYVAIVKAAKAGVGLRLSADEVFDLSMDDAITTRAVVVELGEDN